MRQRYLILLVMLTVLLGTVVVASGIFRQELPGGGHGVDEEASGDPIGAAAKRQKNITPVLTKHRGTAPPVGLQDPQRDPHEEPPAPHEAAVPDEAVPDEAVPPGGVTGVELPHGASGEFRVQPGSQEAPAGRSHHRVRIEVEEGLPVSVEEFSEFAMDSLNHEKSWAAGGAVTFSRTDGDAAIRILLASPGTTDRLCAPLRTNGMWSCGRDGRAVINADRWINGADAFIDAGGDIVAYRHYLLNHEVGHLLFGGQHVPCPAPGQPAPVMLQQSIDLQGCEPNGWANP